MFVLYIFILSVTLWALLNIYKSRLIFPENPPNSTEYVTSSWHPTTKSETTNSKSTNSETTNTELSITHCIFLFDLTYVECISSIHFSLFGQSDQRRKNQFTFFQLLKTRLN